MSLAAKLEQYYYSQNPHIRNERAYAAAVKRNEEERAAVPNFVKGACSCRICGAPADRTGIFLQCQSNPGHIGETITGIFTDNTYRK